MIKIKKDVWLIICSVAVLLFMAYYIADNNINKDITQEAEHIIFTNVDEAIKASDVLIVATVDDIFKSGYTLREVKVDKVFFSPEQNMCYS
jgi:hypoxanthine-guanine phosphoribosyltransferase